MSLILFDFTQKIWAYVIMLLSMTFNGWVLVSVCLGLTAGYSIEMMELEYKIFSKGLKGERMNKVDNHASNVYKQSINPKFSIGGNIY